jgi:hypothetical protein
VSGSGDSCVLPGYRFVGRGPAQRRLLAWLAPRVDCELDVAVAQRSPAGPWALKLHAPGRASEVAALLEAQEWVERVVARPQHLYVRIGGERLCEWVAEGFAPGAPDPLAGDEGRGRSVLVRAVDVDALRAAGEERPLRLFRETAVARSVAALLRSRGFEVRLELLLPAGAGRETYDDVWAAAPGSVTHTVVVGSGVPMPDEVERGDHVVHLPVGEVDVRHGPLRARHGGSVSADDVVGEIGSEAGEAVLALLLLATPRARRVQLDDRAVRREAAMYEALAAAAGLGGDGGGAAADAGERVRDLAAEIDLIATNVARAASAADPAPVTRSLRAIAEQAWAGGREDAAGGRAELATVLPAAIARTARLAGLEHGACVGDEAGRSPTTVEGA